MPTLYMNLYKQRAKNKNRLGKLKQSGTHFKSPEFLKSPTQISLFGHKKTITQVWALEIFLLVFLLQMERNQMENRSKWNDIQSGKNNNQVENQINQSYIWSMVNGHKKWNLVDNWLQKKSDSFKQNVNQNLRGSIT